MKTLDEVVEDAFASFQAGAYIGMMVSHG